MDGINAAFVKLAVVVDETHSTHLLVPVLAKMFFRFFSCSVIPSSWKVARLTPVYKKGDTLLPDNYRLLAVSPVLYRLYSNCISQFLTSWCVKHAVVPDTQFGFYPGRSIQQAQFLLRHVVQVARSSQHKQVWAAFIDFKQAYDKVARQALWGHLKHVVGLPEGLLNPIKALYQDDSYVLVDGQTITDPVRPKVGVKQGCPLSPLLFSLYISDLPTCLTEAQHDQQLGVPLDPHDPACRLSNILFADDLTLLDNSKAGIQRLLQCLTTYTYRKGLTVNASKSAIMVFNPARNAQQHAQPVQYDGVPIPYVTEFKFLGMWIDNRFSSIHMISKLVPDVWAAWRKAIRIAKQQAVLKIPAACLLIIQTFVLPSALFGCQVWAPDIINMSDNMTSSLQRVLLACYKQVLRLPVSVASALLLDEVGAKPLQWYWLKATVKFWNTALSSSNSLLVRAFRANFHYRAHCPALWSARLHRILVLLNQTCEDANGQPVRLQPAVVLTAWRDFWLRSRASNLSDPLNPDCASRQMSTYAFVFRSKPMTEFSDMPAYLRVRSGVPAQHAYSMVRCRLGCLPIGVVLGARAVPQIPFPMRYCNRCHDHEVDTLQHFFLQCHATLPIRSHPSFASLPFNDLRAFMQFPDVKLVATFVHLCCDLLST
jgi:hypothetical protein